MKVKELAQILNAQVIGDGELEVNKPTSLDFADETSTVILRDKEFDLPLRVRVVIAEKEPENLRFQSLILVKDIKKSFLKVLKLFERKPVSFDKFKLDSEFRSIGAGSIIAQNAFIFPFVFIGRNVKIEENVIVYPFVYIGDDVRIGAGTVIYSGVSIYPDVIIGRNVIIHSGSVIGADGFGYIQTERGHEKIPQIGGVIIEDEVEIGANTTIDRATLGYTVIGKGSKLDNLVHIAHNVKVGAYTVMAAQTGIAGSVKIGEWCMFGGQAGVKDHVKIAPYSIVFAQAGIMRDTESGKMYMGTPAKERSVFWREFAALSKLPQLIKKVRKLEKDCEKADNKG